MGSSGMESSVDGIMVIIQLIAIINEWMIAIRVVPYSYNIDVVAVKAERRVLDRLP